MMPNCVWEVAIFTVREEYIDCMSALRTKITRALSELPGFMEMHGLLPAEGEREFADLVQWDTLTHARAAAELFASGDERFRPYMNAIEEVRFMGYFCS